MQEPSFIAQLKQFGGRLGMRLKEYRRRYRVPGNCYLFIVNWLERYPRV
jgi:hypothetical protein